MHEPLMHAVPEAQSPQLPPQPLSPHTFPVQSDVHGAV